MFKTGMELRVAIAAMFHCSVLNSHNSRPGATVCVVFVRVCNVRLGSFHALYPFWDHFLCIYHC